MSSSCDPRTRGTVLRGHPVAARPTFLDTELGHEPALVLVAPPRAEAPGDEPATDRTADEARAAGYDLGFREGYEEGRVVGYADGHESGNEVATAAARRAAEERDASLRDALGALAAAARACNERQAVSLTDIERTMADAIFDLAETLLGRELRHTRTPGRDALVRALALGRAHGNVVAHLHPDDIASLGDLTELLPGRVITVVADPEVEPAGCIVEAGAMKVDAQLGPAIERAKRALLS